MVLSKSMRVVDEETRNQVRRAEVSVPLAKFVLQAACFTVFLAKGFLCLEAF